jgi:hypothetical protein
MKKLQLTLTLLAFSLCCFAQTPFTEQTLNGISSRLVQDGVKCFQEDISSDYTFTFHDGRVSNYDQMKQLPLNSKIEEWNLTDVSIKQEGNAATATGVNKHKVRNNKTQEVNAYTMRFTYSFIFKEGKWLWLSGQHKE